MRLHTLLTVFFSFLFFFTITSHFSTSRITKGTRGTIRTRDMDVGRCSDDVVHFMLATPQDARIPHQFFFIHPRSNLFVVALFGKFISQYQYTEHQGRAYNYEKHVRSLVLLVLPRVGEVLTGSTSSLCDDHFFFRRLATHFLSLGFP